jgi:hypothetical protein
VSAGWVAATVRARAMARRRIGLAGARRLAAAPSLDAALAELVGTPYGHDVRVDHTLAQAQWAVAATLLWDLRVLAGWLPRDGADRLRVLAGWFELANVDELHRAMVGIPAERPFVLGSLGTAWNRLRSARSPDELRQVLAASPWGDPGAATPAAVGLGLRTAWAERVVAAVPPAESWATGAVALLVARERLVVGRRLPDGAATSVRRLLGASALDVVSFPGLATALGGRARWAVRGVDRPEALWQAEARWWARVESDAFTLLHRPRSGLAPVVGAVAATAVDAWRVRAALESAARGGGSGAFDVVA